MRQREYQFIFFLNISHSFYSETEFGKKHSHTWELEVSMHPLENDLVRFREAEQIIMKYLEVFQDKYLNTIPPFHRMNPSIENFLDRIAGDIDTRMKENGWVVMQLRISENPTRSYMIDRQMMDEPLMRVSNEPEEVPVTDENKAAEATEITDAAVAADAEETALDDIKRTEAEIPMVSKLLVDTEGLRVKKQTAGSMTRIVITIP